MARFRRLDVLGQMKRIGLVPIFYEPKIDVARGILSAVSAAGANVVEFTNRGDGALRVFEQLEHWARTEHPELILGIGSIVDAPTAATYISAGANFVVGPLLDRATAKLCNARKIPYCPGCASATEIHEAHLLGVEICKLFPADALGGPAFVKSILGPCPWTEIMPTGGVAPTRESLGHWFESGIACAGMGSNLISRDLIECRDFDAIRRRIVDVLAIIRDLRAPADADSP